MSTVLDYNARFTFLLFVYRSTFTHKKSPFFCQCILHYKKNKKNPWAEIINFDTINKNLKLQHSIKDKKNMLLFLNIHYVKPKNIQGNFLQKKWKGFTHVHNNQIIQQQFNYDSWKTYIVDIKKILNTNLFSAWQFH